MSGLRGPGFTFSVWELIRQQLHLAAPPIDFHFSEFSSLLTYAAALDSDW